MEILRLHPVFKDYIWGGTRLKSDFGFSSSLDRIAEGWMLACHKDGMNTIDGGKFDEMTLNEYIEKNGCEKVVGTRGLDFDYFPVLIKLIDARDNLSIQVHPDNEYARRVEGEYGKTEIWYVLDAARGAELIYGFKHEITKEEFAEAIKNNTLTDVLNSVKVKKGYLFFIEAGTVHAIGKGALIAEIQQNSNTTYRVYDYGRKGADGKPRELHIDKAIAVAQTKPPKYEIKPMGPTEKRTYGTETLLTKCDLFTVFRYSVNGELTLKTGSDSFNHLLITEGEGKIDSVDFKKGDSFFIPANYGKYVISGKFEAIVTKI